MTPDQMPERMRSLITATTPIDIARHLPPVLWPCVLVDRQPLTGHLIGGTR